MFFMAAFLVGIATYLGGITVGKPAAPQAQPGRTSLGVTAGAGLSNFFLVWAYCFQEGLKSFGKAELIVAGGSTLIIGVCCLVFSYIVCSTIPTSPQRVVTASLLSSLLAAVGASIVPLFLVFSLAAGV